MANYGGFCGTGLFVLKSKTPVPLTAVHHDVDVTSFAARIKIQQTYRNTETDPLECVYGFPVNDQAGIIGFVVTIDDRTLVSHFKKKDEAFQEYTEAISRGDGGYLLDQSDRSDDTFVLSVGRLPPGKECTVSIIYVSTLESVTDTKMRLVIPMSLSPRYNPNPGASAGGVVPPEKYQATVPYLATLLGTINAVGVISSVNSPTHPLAVTLVGPQTVSVTFGANQQPLDRDLVIEIEVKTNPQYHVEVERIGENTYAAMYAFIPKATKDTGNNINTELIFLVDCSGSMNEENKIQDATRAMQIFLRSIPEGCYFNFYRFGSQFQSLFDQSQPYSAKSFNEAKDYARDTRANLEGTEILEPIKKIFSAPPQPGFSRQLFVLTDGDITNTEEVIELVRRNAHNTRVFSFGLGNSPSRSLVNGIAIAGNGKSEFIKSGEVLEDKIGRHLQRALQPAITGATVTWSGVRNVRPEASSALPPVFVGDRQLTFAIFEWDGAMETASPAVILQTGDSKVKSVLDVKSVKLTENPFFSKLAARALIKHLETTPTTTAVVGGGSLQKRGVSVKPTELKTDGLAEEITKISLEYGVMSKYVSLVAVETRSEQERNTASGRMQLREIPVQKVQVISPSVGNGMFRTLCMKQSIDSYDMDVRACSIQSNASLGRVSSACPREVRAMSRFSPKAKKAQGIMANLGGFFARKSTSADVDDEHDSGAEFSMPGSRSGSGASSWQSPLNVLLDLQQWDGSWTFSSEVEAITKVSAAEAATVITKALGVGKHDVILATLLVVTYVKDAFPDKSNIWKAILNKADTFLAKRANGLDVSSVSAALLALIKSK